MAKHKGKGSIFKKWWFWLIIVCVLSLVAGGDSDQPVEGTTPTTTESSYIQTEESLQTVPGTIVEETESLQNTTTPENTEATTPAESSFNIHFIDVGQADAALVECDGHYMLIDGGNKADSNVIYSVLKKASVPKLDIVVGTHAHEDHIGGLPGAFNYTTADLTLCPVKSYDSNAFEDFAKYAAQKGGGITIPTKGSTYTLGSATVKILGVNGGSDTNDTSIILRIDYGKTSFLFTGDAERDAEQHLLSASADLSATVLKVGHHGSDTSTTYPFLREIMPQYAIISVGADNSYGHPTADTLSRLRDADVKVFRTDLQGDIYCTSDGETVNISASRNADADAFSGIPNNSSNNTSNNNTPTTTPTESNTPVVEDTGLDYVVNTNTGKFHRPTCRYVDDIKSSNRWDYHGTSSYLEDSGYKACKVCKP